MAEAIVTGGSGYVGTHLIRHLLQENHFQSIVNVDLREPALKPEDGQRLHYVKADVRNPLDSQVFKKLGCGAQTVIFNLAAICKIPGFPLVDYFRTNIRGAETVCRLAEELDSGTIIFTSSIALYGSSEETKTEESIPQPDNAYGSSKLAAEYIHKGWQQKAENERNLVILRPGVIFGKNEGANFVRLYQAQKKGYFVYPGRKDTRKACIYVKDVARACSYFAGESRGFQVYNLCYTKPPTIKTICEAIAGATDGHPPKLTVPGMFLKGIARCIAIGGKITGKDFAGIHPDRVRKLMISTNISGKKLSDSPFELQYSLRDGIKEWFEECKGSLY